MLLLDTNVISELRKIGDGRAHAGVTAWIAEQDAETLFVSVLTMMELEIGVLRMERRDPGQGRRLRAWLDEKVMPEFADRTLPVDGTVALRCARLHILDPRAERDALIAATALVHGMSVVTRNIRDFDATGVPIIDPWTHGA